MYCFRKVAMQYHLCLPNLTSLNGSPTPGSLQPALPAQFRGQVQGWGWGGCPWAQASPKAWPPGSPGGEVLGFGLACPSAEALPIPHTVFVGEHASHWCP